MMENTANLVRTTCVVFFCVTMYEAPTASYDDSDNNNNNNNIDDLLNVSHNHPLSYKESHVYVVYVTQSFQSLRKRCP